MLRTDNSCTDLFLDFLFYSIDLYGCFEISKYESSNFDFLFQDCFSHLESLAFLFWPHHGACGILVP